MRYTEDEINKIADAASKGDSDAQLEWGRILKNIDEKEALKWIASSAKNGNIEAICEFGLLYEDGKCGLEQNFEKAVMYYLYAAKQGNSNALLLLNALVDLKKIKGENYASLLEFYLSRDEYKIYVGKCYEYGIGTAVDENKAMNIYRELLKANDENAYNQVIHYFYDRGNTDVVMALCQRADKLFNNQFVSMILGKTYGYGKKELRNEEAAFNYFSKTSKCKTDIARCYYTGKGVEQDISKSISVYKELIDSGDKSAEYPYQVLCDLQGRSILTIRDISEIDISEIDESVVGAIQIIPEENEDIEAHTLYSLDDYKNCIDIINTEILNDVEQNNGNNELEIFLKICTKLSANIMYDDILEKRENERR